MLAGQKVCQALVSRFGLSLTRCAWIMTSKLTRFSGPNHHLSRLACQFHEIILLLLTSFFLHTKSLKPIRLQYIKSAQYVIGSPLCGNCDNFLSQKFRENDAFSTKLNRTNVLMYECKLFSWNCFLVRVTFQNFHTANSCLFYSNKKNGTWVHSIEILPCKSANFMWNQFGWIKTLNTAT